MKIAFIGAGKMATAIAGGLLRTDAWPAAALAACDINPVARDNFTAATGLVCQEKAENIIPDADIVILAVKPQVMQQTLLPLQNLLREKLLVSIAAGIRLRKITVWSSAARIVRVMPNTPALVGQGAACFACSDTVEPEEKKQVTRIFAAVGMAAEVPEAALDAVTALSGSGPAYVFEFIQALVDAAAGLGLDAGLALELAAQTVSGAAAMVKQKNGTPDELRDAVTSPGGTTAAALEVLRDNQFRQLIGKALQAACARSRELSE